VALQNVLRQRVVLRGSTRDIRLVAGADVAYAKHRDVLYGGIVVLRLPDLTVVDQSSATGRVVFPYVPGLLCFREAPILLAALDGLKTEPDVFLFDGHGIAHPRGMGLATYMGVLLDKPSVGCAKSRLVGEHDPVGPNVGDWTKLVHKGKTAGAVLRTREGVKPVFVSRGHRIGLRSAVRLVLRTCGRFRLPEPTRQAHLLVNKIRRT